MLQQKGTSRERGTRRALLIGLLVLGVTGCDFVHDKGDSIALSSLQGARLAIPAFADVEAQIFEPKCSHCHSQFADYASVLKDLDLIKQHALVLRDMPKAPEAPLTDAQYELLAAWIEAGGPEAAPAPEPSAEPSTEPSPEPSAVPSPEPSPEPSAEPSPAPSALPILPTFASLSATVFKSSCVSCHTSGPEAPVQSDNGTNVFFDSEQELIAAGEIVPGNAAASKLYQRVMLSPDVDGHMPDSGPMLPDNVLTAIHDWIQSLPAGTTQ